MAKSIFPDRKVKKNLDDLKKLSPGLLHVKVKWFFDKGRFETAWHAAAWLVAHHPDENAHGLWHAVHEAWFHEKLRQGDLAFCRLLCAEHPPGMDAAFISNCALHLALAEDDPLTSAVHWVARLEAPGLLSTDLLARLEAVCAAHYLFVEPEREPPVNAPLFARRLAAARRALAAFCHGDDDAVRDALKPLPFRSGFRDLVLLLKAGLDLGRLSPDADFERRLMPDSPFLPLWRMMLAARRPPSTYALWQARPDWARRLIAGLCGLSHSTYALIVCLEDPTLGPAERLYQLMPLHQALVAEDEPAAARVAHFARQWLPHIEPDPVLDDYWMGDDRARLVVLAKRAEQGRDRFRAAALWFEVADLAGDDGRACRLTAVHHALTLLLEMERGGFDCLSFGFDVAPRLEWMMAQVPQSEASWLLMLDWLAEVERAQPRLRFWLEKACNEKAETRSVMRKAWTLARRRSDLPSLCQVGKTLLALEPLAHDVRACLIGRLEHVLMETENQSERLSWLAVFDDCAQSVLERALFHLYEHHFNPAVAASPVDWARLSAPLRSRPALLLRWYHQAVLLGGAPESAELGFDPLAVLTAWRPTMLDLQQLLDAWSLEGGVSPYEPLMTQIAKAWVPHLVAGRSADAPPAAWSALVESALEHNWLSLADQMLATGIGGEGTVVQLLRGRLYLAQGKAVPNALLQSLDDCLFEAVAHNQTKLAGEIEHFFALLEEYA